MKREIKRWLMRQFNLCDRSEHDLIWKKWSDSVTMNYTTLDKMQRSLDSMASSYARQTLELERTMASNRRMIMDLSIMNVAPIESMSRALDILRCLLQQDALCRQLTTDIERALVRAISELEHGVQLTTKRPSVKGAA